MFLTVSLNDLRNEKYSLEENNFTFTGESGPEGLSYAVKLPLYKDVIPQVGSYAENDLLNGIMSCPVLG